MFDQIWSDFLVYFFRFFWIFQKNKKIKKTNLIKSDQIWSKPWFDQILKGFDQIWSVLIRFDQICFFIFFNFSKKMSMKNLMKNKICFFLKKTIQQGFMPGLWIQKTHTSSYWPKIRFWKALERRDPKSLWKKEINPCNKDTKTL